MKKNIIIAILSTFLISWVVLVIIGLSINKNDDVKKTDGMQVFKDAYVEGCTEDGNATFTQCSCSYDKMLEFYGEDGFLKMAANYVEDEELPAGAIKAILPCFAK